MDKHRNNLKRKMKLIIVIGLPASGKTTYYNENLKNSHLNTQMGVKYLNR